MIEEDDDMTYQKLMTEPMPTYTKGEEVFNLVTHIIGGGFGLLVLIFSIVIAFMQKIDFYQFFALSVFSITCIVLYTISSIYHGLKPHRTSKRVMRIIDHCTIYLLIAGTYTPVCMLGLRGTIWCPIILAIEWLMAIGGIVMNAIDLNNKIVKIISMIFYILGGWIVVFFPPAIKLLPFNAFLFILIGGVVYTIGSVLYGIGAKKKWYHSIFHIFCLGGTFIQFVGLLFLVF